MKKLQLKNHNTLMCFKVQICYSQKSFLLPFVIKIVIYFLHAFFVCTDVPGPPSKPTIKDVQATQMTIKWTPPESDGGARITNYIVERKDTFATRWIRVTRDTISETTFTVGDLMEGTEYVFRVLAENKAGPGPASPPSDSKVAKPPYGKNFTDNVA